MFGELERWCMSLFVYTSHNIICLGESGIKRKREKKRKKVGSVVGPVCLLAVPGTWTAIDP